MKYSVILADPPWQYRNNGLSSSAESHYNTMTDEEIKALPIKSLSCENAILVLWATWPKMKEACLDVISSWGFEYITGFPWIKVKELTPSLFGGWQIKTNYGTGFWALGITEPILLAKRGKITLPELPLAGLLAESFIHSRKPNDIYEYCEQFEGPYIELFARRKRNGWHSWGNEIESDIVLGTS